MTLEQIRASENGVHLCARCADLVDKLPNEFSPSKLQAMQQNAEERARTQVMWVDQEAPTLPLDRAERLRAFVQALRNAVGRFQLFRNGATWIGSWTWTEVCKADAFIREAAGVARLDHRYSSGTPSRVGLQVAGVEAVRSLRSQIDSPPWLYIDNYPPAYCLGQSGDASEVNAAGEKAAATFQSVHDLAAKLEHSLEV